MCVLGHLREVKDPFRAAQASRLLPSTSCIRVTQIGGALGEKYEMWALGEGSSNPRYSWLGEHPRWKAIRLMARSRLLVLTSVMEGGANAVSEALACSVPVISSRISGSIGLLGEDYQGYFSVGDTSELADLMNKAETDSDFYEGLNRACEERSGLVAPERERDSWRQLLSEVVAR